MSDPTPTLFEDSQKLMDELLEPQTIQRSFEKFHRRHPWVYRELVELARDLKDRGYKHCAIGMLWEVVRWKRYRQTTDGSEFRLNNNYRSRYARMIMDNESELADFFETRELKSE